MTQVDRIAGLIGSIAIKAPCRVATTANITLSGEQTIDGVAVVSGDRVLVKDQTNQTENGIWDASTTAWTRSPDFNGNRDFVKGTAVRVIEGTGGGIYYEVTSEGVTVGTSNITITATTLPLTPDAFYLVANKTAAKALTVVDGDKVFITSDDGGEFTVRYDAGESYTDDDATYCGRWFIPTGGDGTIWIERNTTKNISSKAYGTVADGSTDDLAKLQSLDNSTAEVKYLPSGDYYLSANWEPPTQDFALTSAPDIEFSNARPDLNNLIPYQNSPGDLWSQSLIRKTYGAAWAGFGNIFQTASFAKSDITTVPVVAVFGQGEGTVAGSKVWGGNFVAYANNATATSIGIELNCGVLTAGGSAYGLVVAAAGAAGQPKNAIQIQTNTVAGQFIDGINFQFDATLGSITGDLIHTVGASGATCEKLIGLTGLKATTAEIDIPSFAVAATPATVDGRIIITASTDANATVGVAATSTNANLTIKPKGTGNIQLTDGSNNLKLDVGDVGIGFFGTGEQAKPTITGSAGGNAALASLLTELETLGLITDSST